jgi:dienelactone hydrolase
MIRALRPTVATLSVTGRRLHGMTQIALFHSVLGIRPGIVDAAHRLRAAGHDVLVVDQYDGRVFDDYPEAMAHAEDMGYPALMRRAAEAVAELPDGFVVAGFSNGGGMAVYVATQRAVSGVLMLAGAMPVGVLGAEAAWPAGVPAQIHYTLDDPYRSQGEIDQTVLDVEAAGGSVETFDYPGSGHLFTDASLPKEYDRASAELMWARALTFVGGR